MKNRTKIVCTIGPSCIKLATLKGMAIAGMNFARINMSHGDYSYYRRIVNNVRKIPGHKVQIMTDTKGPELRVGELEKTITIERHTIATILTKDFSVPKTPNTFCVLDSTKKHNTAKDVKVGDRIYVDDGKLCLVTKSVDVERGIIKARSRNKHNVRTNMRINLPDSKYTMPFLSETDVKGILNTIKLKAEWIALSFVCNAGNIKEVRQILDKNGGKKIKIISKIETQDALNNLNSIIKESDAIMVARGDLALETPYYDIPYWEEKIIKLCNKVHKPVIVATQMLDSLERNIQPTRAEVTDVYFAVANGTYATMLSGETAKGINPVHAVKVMAAIIKAAENRFNKKR